MIIDTHVHLIGLREDNGCFLSDKMSGGFVYQLLSYVLGLRGVEPEELDDAFREQLTEWVDESDVDGIGLLALDGVYDDDGELDYDRTHVVIGNDYCLEVAGDSDKFLPICSVNPRRKDAIEELERVVEAGAVAIKMLPNSQDFDPSAPDHQPFWERMVQLGVPLLTHTSFEHTIPAYEQEYGRPERLVPVLQEGVTVIAAHCASAGVAHIHEDFDTWQSMLREYPNLYGDISAMASMARFPYISKVLDDPLARDRAVLGSDFPIPVSPWLFSTKIGIKKAMELGKIQNPIQKNYETFRALGVEGAIMR
ncbi:MAG: amidohydrolase family protein, partial [Myxococcota bacterium]